MSFLDDLLNDPRSLNSAGTVTQAAGEMMGGISHIEFGIQSRQAAEFQAAQLRLNASNAAASGQRQAADVDLQSKYIASAALATAAASGGGASDPGVVTLMARNAAEGAYKRSVALYEGEDRAKALNLSADAKEFEGKNVLANSVAVGASQFVGAGTTLLRGAAKDRSLFQRFGGGGPGVDTGES
jgi:hypothetical protein